MQITLITRKKASDHSAAFDRRNKEGVEKYGVDWVKTQDRVLVLIDSVVDRVHSSPEDAFVKDLVSLIALELLKRKKPMLTPKEFLLSLGALPCSAAHDAMQLYADYCMKEQELRLAETTDAPTVNQIATEAGER